MHPWPLGVRSRRSTREWMQGKARALRWRPPISGCAPGRRTRRKARPPSSKSAHPNFTDAETQRQRARNTTMASDNIFSGLRVVDLASFIAGPGAAVILSDFGADVIKVEPPSGDLWRIGYKIPPQPRAQDNYPWHLSNRNKRGLVLDLKSPDAAAVLE